MTDWGATELLLPPMRGRLRRDLPLLLLLGLLIGDLCSSKDSVQSAVPNLDTTSHLGHSAGIPIQINTPDSMWFCPKCTQQMARGKSGLVWKATLGEFNSITGVTENKGHVGRKHRARSETGFCGVTLVEERFVSEPVESMTRMDAVCQEPSGSGMLGILRPWRFAHVVEGTGKKVLTFCSFAIKEAVAEEGPSWQLELLASLPQHSLTVRVCVGEGGAENSRRRRDTEAYNRGTALS
ncbi:unnamed protein product [Pleuronectes platessa]|uniref:Uncharacterized protein n=1 Tax=Pleuronectes platessa TaxID=8262 RepID=A0A9N7UE81_PLEPL|nr:unnamed protein product [Pleuronectes platessa]